MKCGVVAVDDPESKKKEPNPAEAERLNNEALDAMDKFNPWNNVHALIVSALEEDEIFILAILTMHFCTTAMPSVSKEMAVTQTKQRAMNEKRDSLGSVENR